MTDINDIGKLKIKTIFIEFYFENCFLILYIAQKNKIEI